MLRTTISTLLWLILPGVVYAPNDTQDRPSRSADGDFSFNPLSSLGLSIGHGADIAPILGVAQIIESGNFTSYSHNLWALANETKAAATKAESQSDATNARDTCFIAANYFRNADFYLHETCSGPLIYALGEERLHDLEQAIASLPCSGQRLHIPSNSFMVKATWYVFNHDAIKRSTRILGNGYDGSQEVLYHTDVVPALAR
ncbi:hypothetical protein LTR86_000753 [Recurvomyces mirabilis]|nr:hypothetical protein LTR86_000753 [Recurvomyces mirabilis]